MEFKMESQDTKTKSKIQSRRGAIALAENLGGVVWGTHTLQHYLQSPLLTIHGQTDYI